MIPVSEPLFGRKEIEYIIEAIKTGWVSSAGKFIKKFEKEFASYIGKKYGVVVNNGTNALILALRALNLPKGSEVIVPTFTIISCALACIYNDLVPVFVDCEPDTWNMDVNQIEGKITQKTKAIMVVHIYGHPVDMDKIMEVAKSYNLYIIEDAAEAIGSEYKSKKCGSFGDISCFSFYANKAITTGEGGMCLTDDEYLAEKMKRLRNLAFIHDKRFVHYELGFNFRMTNIQAAIGLAQLERIEKHIEKKVWIGKTYTKFLEEIDGIKLPVEKKRAKNTYWMYGIVLDKCLNVTAREFSEELQILGIQTRPFFYPLHLQPAFKNFPWFKEQNLPVSESLYRYGLYLPSGLTLEEKDIRKVVNAVKKILVKLS